MNYRQTFVLTALLAGLLVSPAAAQRFTSEFTVTAGPHDRRHVPVRVLLQVPAEFADVPSAMVLEASGRVSLGQLTPPGLAAGQVREKAGHLPRELHFLLGTLDAGESLGITVYVTEPKQKPQTSFVWTDTEGQYSELSFGDRPVLRYMYEALDESTAERRMETYKPYHHVYDPQGQRLVTKGPGGLYPHHRGLYYGFNRISYDGGQKQADTWHCNRGEYQSHEKFLARQAGPVLGRHRVAIDWHGQDGGVFAREQREMGVYNVPGGLLIEFASRLESSVGDVKLDGDPQHAGFQFRGSQEIPDKTRQLTYYLRPDGKDKPGSFRNWPGHKQHVNLPWNAMSFVLGETRYTCCYLDHPGNPKEARYSERDYGRFGSYFEYELNDATPLALNYRVWLQEGEMTVDEVQAHSANFVSPVQVAFE